MTALTVRMSEDRKAEIEENARRLGVTVTFLLREGGLNYSRLLLKQKQSVFGAEEVPA